MKTYRVNREIFNILKEKGPLTLEEIETEYASRWVKKGKTFKTGIVRKSDSGIYDLKKKGFLVVVGTKKSSKGNDCDLLDISSTPPTEGVQLINQIKRCNERIIEAERTKTKLKQKLKTGGFHWATPIDIDNL